jgi:hypothetical protein
MALERLNLKVKFPARSCILTLIVGCVLCASLSATVQAAPGPNTVLVGVYVLNVGEFDLRTGSYTMDFYLSMRCPTVACNFGSFEFLNGRASSISLEENSTTEKFWRIQATLYENLDLHRYPFDSHTLYISIEDELLTTRNLNYQPDPTYSGVDPSIVVVGWSVSGWSQTVVDHYYQMYNETYSRYTFSLTLDREPTSGVAIFIPVLLLTFIALMATLMYGDVSSVFENRILLSASLLIAAVLFQFSLDSGLPPLGYLTFADWFMIATYFVMAAALVSGILALMYHHRKDAAKLKKTHYYSTRLLPPLAIALYLLLFLFFA